MVLQQVPLRTNHLIQRVENYFPISRRLNFPASVQHTHLLQPQRTQTPLKKIQTARCYTTTEMGHYGRQ